MGGHARVKISSVSQAGHVLSSLSPRFIRVCVSGGVTDGSEGNNRRVRLPDATELPMTPGAPIFTVWNEGYFNLDIITHTGTSVGCLKGHNGSGFGGGQRTNLFLMSASDSSGVWKISTDSACGNHPATASEINCGSSTGAGGGTTQPGGTSDTDTDEGGITNDTGTDTQITQTSDGHGGSLTFHMHAPLPFPGLPAEVPMPARQPHRVAEEGI